MKKYKFTIGGNKYEVELKNFDEDIANIEVNGTSYDVEIHREVKQTKTPRLVRPAVVNKPGEGTISKAGAGKLVIKAPLPGNIMQLFVQQGDKVTKGQKILMYEAMKMENDILAEKDGVISSIKVKPGDSVLQGDALLEIQ